MRFSSIAFLAFVVSISCGESVVSAAEEDRGGLRGGADIGNNAMHDSDSGSISTNKVQLVNDNNSGNERIIDPHVLKSPNPSSKTVAGEILESPHPDASTVVVEHPEPTKRVIVTYKEGCKSNTTTAMQIASQHRASGEPEIQVDYDFEDWNTFVITGTDKEIAEVENNPDVLTVEIDQPRYPASMPMSNSDVSRLLEDVSRNLADTMPYGVGLVEAPAMWAKGFTGQGVKVCVIDSGIEASHPDFASTNLDGVGTWFQDGCGHGTHVSGTISGEDNEFGVIGVAPDAEIFTVRVFGNDCGFAFSSGVYNAARICRDNGADIISMSLGGPGGTNFENSVFNSLFNDDDILLVAAAGNDGDTSFSFPASYPAVMSVAAINSAKQHASFSQRNSQVEIAAPGVGVLSIFPIGGCAICRFNTNGFGAIDGTSMATPHVSGVAALLKNAFPGASALELRNALTSSAEDRGSAGRDDFYGFGIVQAEAAFNVLAGGDGSGGGASTCSDTQGWHDSDGDEFDCGWYAQKTNCQVYGNDFEFQGETATEACCVCGGGTETAPTGSQPENGGCTDSPVGWFDSEGSLFDCAWYANGDRCDQYGNGFANQGTTANEACCVCGGGDSS